jgi:predicted transcriptional regulator YdeE
MEDTYYEIGKAFIHHYSTAEPSNGTGQIACGQPGHYSCYFNYEQGDTGHYEVMVSLNVREASQDQYPKSVKTFTVPAAKYAVFVTERGPIIEVVQRAWADIWQWSKQSGNERAFTGDFEYYHQDIDPDDGQAEIYIALKK